MTVLFADLVGFTARAETLDPEDVDAVLRPYHERLRAELERWGGTVEKFIGDAVVAVFGAPTAREDDPERAVRAALAIRDWATEEDDLEVRIAVNTGEALVSLDARPSAGEGIVTGDVVNTASRLQGAAPVNGILVGEQTQRATRDVIEYREAEPVEAKGKRAPVAVWEAVNARSRFGVDVRQHGGAPLVGRTRELDALTSTLDRVRDEREPQLVTVVGVPGIGKSRLVWELFEHVSRGDELTYWRQGRSLPFGEGVSFWAVAEMVKAQAGILEDDAEEVVAQKLDSAVREVVDEDVDWVIARLRPLVGGEPDRSSSRDESFTAWRTLFEGLAERRPLVLVFEDLHWADDGLLDFVDHLADWSSGVPMLVLCTSRPELLERRPGWGGGKRNALTLNVSPLTNEDSAKLLALVLNRAVLPAETQQTLLERASGNPLYAEQFARLYEERGAVDAALPESVHGVIAARLDGLPADEKSLLQDAAVMGKVFWSGSLEARPGARDGLHALERKEFIRRERRSSVAGEEEFAFRHVLVRDVAYGQIPRAERAAKHIRAGSWIEGLGRPQDHSELLAGHYVAVLGLDPDGVLLSGDVRERAVRALGAAAERAHGLNNFAGATAYARTALELAGDDGPGRARLLFQLGKAEVSAAGGGHEILLEAASAFEASGDAESAAESRVLVALGGYELGREDQIEEQLGQAAALVADRRASRAKATVWSARARHAYLAGRIQEAHDFAAEALELATSLGADEIRSESLLYLGGAKVDGGDPTGIEEMRESLVVAKSINSAVMITRALNNLSIVLRLAGHVEEAAAAADEGVSVAERFGMASQLMFARGAVPFRHYEHGRWDEAVQGADAYLEELGERQGRAGNEASTRFALAHIALARDDGPTALEHTQRAVDLANATMAALPKYPAYVVRGYVLAALGRVADARRILLELIDLRRERGERAPFGGDGVGVWTWEQAGLLEELLEVMGTGWVTPWLEAARTVAADGWVAALPIYERIGTPTSVAFARLQAGRDADLRAALDFYRPRRASLYVRQAEAKLAAIA